MKRGAKAIEASIAKLAKKVGKPKPLTEEQIAAAEEAAGVALSPALYALLSFDAGMMKRDYGWFDDKMRLLARPTIDVIGDHAGPFREAYEPLCEARFPGKAIALDQGSDSMRLLYFGDPDDEGEYPVLFIDHDDLPILGVEYPGFDYWLAGKSTTKENEKRCKEMLGVSCWEMQDDPGEYPDPVPGPAPGSIARAPAKKKKEKKLTEAQRKKALLEAAEEGLADEVRDLAKGAKKKVLDEALIMAARSGSAETIRAVLDAGANPKAKGYYGCALSAVMYHANVLELVKLFLEAGADPNGPSVNGETVMHQAVEHAPIEVIRVLLEAGGDPNHEDNSGLTPLGAAAQGSVGGPGASPEVIDLLIEHGAKVDGGSSHSTPLAWAIQSGRAAHAARLIARGAKIAIEKDDYLKRTPLHHAYDRNDDAMVRTLIAAGADRTTKDARGISLETIYGPKGEDIRPIAMHYTASDKSQTVTIACRVAVLNHVHLAMAGATLAAARWTEIINEGLGGGADFPPGTSTAKVIEEPVWKAIAQNGFTDLRWVLEVASVSPIFFKLIAFKLLGGSGAFTGAGAIAVVRGTSLDIRGSIDPKPVPLRDWMADPSAQLGEWREPLPFPLEIESGPSRVLLVAKDGKTIEHTPIFHNALHRWFELSATWPRSGMGGLMLGAPTKKAGGGFPIVGFVPGTAKSTDRWPFTSDAPIVALRSALHAIHAKVPLARAVLTTNS